MAGGYVQDLHPANHPPTQNVTSGHMTGTSLCPTLPNWLAVKRQALALKCGWSALPHVTEHFSHVREEQPGGYASQKGEEP